jgi:hypothetical protein
MWQQAHCLMGVLLPSANTKPPPGSQGQRQAPNQCWLPSCSTFAYSCFWASGRGSGRSGRLPLRGGDAAADQARRGVAGRWLLQGQALLRCISARHGSAVAMHGWRQAWAAVGSCAPRAWLVGSIAVGCGCYGGGW